MFDWLWRLLSEDWLDRALRAPRWRGKGAR